MSLILLRYVAWTYLKFFFGIFGVVLAIFLVADFVDRAHTYTGPGWVTAVIELYAYKSLQAARQLAPAAMLLAAGAAVSALRKTGEVTAIRSLGIGPFGLYGPVAAVALLLGGALVVFDEKTVVPTGVRVDELTTGRFNSWGDWYFYFVPKRWFRVEDRMFHVRVGDPERGYEGVTILTLTPDFHLGHRIDAETMQWVEGTRWVLGDAVERTFLPGGGTRLELHQAVETDLGVGRDAFAVRTGRPEQMPWRELLRQVEIRRGVGIATAVFELALHNRLAYPLAGVPAALLAVGLALRANRRGHLMVALGEGLLVVTGMWALMVVSRALVLGERISPAVAAWLPVVVLTVAATALWLRHEGLLRWGKA